MFIVEFGIGWFAYIRIFSLLNHALACMTGFYRWLSQLACTVSLHEWLILSAYRSYTTVVAVTRHLTRFFDHTFLLKCVVFFGFWFSLLICFISILFCIIMQYSRYLLLEFTFNLHHIGMVHIGWYPNNSGYCSSSIEVMQSWKVER